MELVCDTNTYSSVPTTVALNDHTFFSISNMYSLLSSVRLEGDRWKLEDEDIIISFSDNNFLFQYTGDDPQLRNLVITFCLQLLYELEERKLYDYEVDYRMDLIFRCNIHVNVGCWPISKCFLPVREPIRMEQIATSVAARTFRSIEIIIAQSVPFEFAECAFLEFV